MIKRSPLKVEQETEMEEEEVEEMPITEHTEPENELSKLDRAVFEALVLKRDNITGMSFFSERILSLKRDMIP